MGLPSGSAAWAPQVHRPAVGPASPSQLIISLGAPWHTVNKLNIKTNYRLTN